MFSSLIIDQGILGIQPSIPGNQPSIPGIQPSIADTNSLVHIINSRLLEQSSPLIVSHDAVYTV